MKKELLDHGHIELIEHWGSDERIIEAARMSTAKGFQGWGTPETDKCRRCGALRCHVSKPWVVGYPCKEHAEQEHDFEAKPGDEKLLRHLWTNHHTTPFEMAGAIIEVQAPIFVFREWHRHRTQSYNEMSARYTPLPNVNYVPTVERLLMSAGSNKQAQGLAPITARSAEIFREVCAREYTYLQTVYEDALANGVPKELARIILPVGRYSRMRASANLRNWLAFLTLRSDKNPGAQWEIKQYANALHDILAEKFPRTLALFDEGAKP